VIRREPDPASPRLRVLLDGKEYYKQSGPKRWEITQSLNNMFDGWSLELDNSDGRNDHLLEANPHRWLPITLQHSDPLVDNGQPRPAVMGVVTRMEQTANADATSIRLSGYDLGKLFDSSGPTWYRIRGHTWKQLLDKMIDPSWKAPEGPSLPGSEQWGIKGIRSGYLNRKIRIGRYAAIVDYGAKYQEFMPPIQIEPGETCYDTLTRYARLTGYVGGTTGSGSLVSVSADGFVEIYQVDDMVDDPPLYTFDYHKDERNKRIKSGTLVLDGEQLYSHFELFWTVIRLPYKKDSRDPNAGKHKAIAEEPRFLGVERKWSGSDGEAYLQEYADARVEWKRRQARYSEMNLVYEVQGHSWPGAGALSGRWVPIVEGHVADVRDSRNKVYDRLMVESVTWRADDAPQGATSRVCLRRLGLLGS
jgi:hypothetical protein